MIELSQKDQIVKNWLTLSNEVKQLKLIEWITNENELKTIQLS